LLDEQGKLQLGGVHQNVTILFCEIQGFTTFSEDAGADQVFQTLHEYFSRMVGVITSHGGIVNKFIGNALMALFGVPIASQPGQDARNACRAALSMQRELNQHNRSRAEQGKPSLRVGVGISTGRVHCGNIGSEQSFEYTVIGDSVNVASRLESSTKEYSVPNLICSNTYESIRDSGLPIKVFSELSPQERKSPDLGLGPQVLFLREVDVARVTGKSKTTRLFEVLGEGAAVQSIVDTKTEAALGDFAAGLRAYRQRNIPEAIELFERAADAGDGAALIFEERCDFLLEKGGYDKPEFSGVWDMRRGSAFSMSQKPTRRASAAAASASPVALRPVDAIEATTAWEKRN
jgi:adenylate cyclase